MPTQPFHPGELEAQARAGETVLANRNSGALRDSIPAGAMSFIREQQMAILAREDQHDNLWCSLLFGPAGFLRASPDGRHFSIATEHSSRSSADPFWQHDLSGRLIGILLLELATRRRLKINGQATLAGTTLQLDVTESFPLCPKYIQTRALHLDPSAAPSTPGASAGTTLGHDQLATIRLADTFFVASTHADHGPDASHRGGPTGFVGVLPDATLRIPDYPGNGMFNTFGNLLLDPRAGLVFFDFTRRIQLQLTGTAQVSWQSPGRERSWHFTPTEWHESPLPEGLTAPLLEFSPYNPPL